MKTFYVGSTIVFTLALFLGLVACSENEPFDHTYLAYSQGGGATGGDGGSGATDSGADAAGNGGSSGEGGSAGFGGSSGSGGTAGTGGFAGSGGSAGTGGSSGSGGFGGSAGTGGGPNECVPNQTAPCAITMSCQGQSVCTANGSWGACLALPEVCGDGLDNDCNGAVDDNCSLGCNANQSGRVVRYRFTMPSGIVAKQLSVFDEADSASGVPLPRPSSCGGTEYDETYAWGTGWDCGCADTCYRSSVSTIDCIVHRPVGSTIRANVDIWFLETTERVWACATESNSVIGIPQFWVDGQAVTPTYELWPQPGKAPACRFILKL